MVEMGDIEMISNKRKRLVGDHVAIKYNLNRDEMRYLAERMRAKHMHEFSVKLSQEIEKKFNIYISPWEVRHFRDRENVSCPDCGATVIDYLFGWDGSLSVRYKGTHQWKLVE